MTIFNPNSNFIGQLSGQKGIDLISNLDYKIDNFLQRCALAQKEKVGKNHLQDIWYMIM